MLLLATCPVLSWHRWGLMRWVPGRELLRRAFRVEVAFDLTVAGLVRPEVVTVWPRAYVVWPLLDPLSNAKRIEAGVDPREFALFTRRRSGCRLMVPFHGPVGARPGRLPNVAKILGYGVIRAFLIRTPDPPGERHVSVGCGRPICVTSLSFTTMGRSTPSSDGWAW
jgi:hypothetical protein